MRKAIFLILVLIVASPSRSLAPGTAQNFLDRANRLKAKGPFAYFDSDYAQLKADATAVGKSIGDDRIAAERTGRPILYFSPRPRAQLGSFEFIDGLEAIRLPSARA